MQATTTQETDELPAKSKACTDAGKPAIDIVKFDGQDAGHQRRRPRPGRRHVGGLPGDAVRDQAEQRQARAGRRDLRLGALRLAGQEGLPAGGSRCRRRSSTSSTSGDYKTIAANWGVEEGMIDKPVINGATS